LGERAISPLHASVRIGSTLSHNKHEISVLPSGSKVGTSLFPQSKQRVTVSMTPPPRHMRHPSGFGARASSARPTVREVATAVAVGLIGTLAASQGQAESAGNNDTDIAALKQQLRLMEQKLEKLQKQTSANAAATAKTNTKVDHVANANAAIPVKAAPAPSDVIVSMPGNRPTICTADNQNCVAITSRLHWDVGGYAYRPNSPATSPQRLDGGENVRRARIGVVGKFLGDWNYALIYDFGGSSDGVASTASAGVEEGRAGVFHQVPTVGDLYRVRERLCRGLAVAAATVARYGPDLRMIGEPRSNCRDLAIWKQGYDPPPLEIADNGFVTAIASKGPIVDADDGQRIGSPGCPPSYNTKQRIIADRQHQPHGEARCWSAAECQPQMVDDAFQPSRPARPGGENIVPEPFSENPPAAIRHLANKPPRDHAEAYLLAGTGQIRDLSVVSAMDSSRSRAAQWALGHSGFGSDGQNNRVR